MLARASFLPIFMMSGDVSNPFFPWSLLPLSLGLTYKAFIGTTVPTADTSIFRLSTKSGVLGSWIAK